MHGIINKRVINMVMADGIFRPEGGGVKPILPAYRQVADQLLSLIIDGEIKPGERLPTEETLAKCPKRIF